MSTKVEKYTAESQEARNYPIMSSKDIPGSGAAQIKEHLKAARNAEGTSVNPTMLQISGTVSSEVKSGKKGEENHEHPCVCDLRLPRKSLSNEERYEKAKNYLRKTGKGSERKRMSPKRTGKRVIGTIGGKGLRGSPKRETSRGRSRQRILKSTREGAKSPPASTGSAERSRLDLTRGPRIAVKMNRAANLRMEKGSTYCGKQFRPKFVKGRAEDEEVKKKRRRPVQCEYLKCKRIK